MGLFTAFRTIRLGVRSLRLHKLRSFLTMLGILFGVSSVIAMLAIGEGASEQSQEEIRKLGADNIILRSIKPSSDDQSSMQTSRARGVEYGLKETDQRVIRRTIPGVERVVGLRSIVKPTSAGDRKLEMTLSGTTPDYLLVANVEVDEGRFLELEDMVRKENAAVIGAEVRRQLFPFENPIGKWILVGSEAFRVVGTLKPRGGATENNMEGSDEDKVSYCPLPTMLSRFGTLDIKRSAGSRSMERVELHELRVKSATQEAVPHVATAVRDILARLHDKEDYEVVVPLELLKAIEKNQKLWTAVLAAIAGISLLVGGIGVMNVMLATVTERTREIGIRRALGAKRRHIVSQFLVETLVLSTAGGALGVVLGIAIPGLVEQIAENIRTVIKPNAAILAFSISALVGVVFGLYPAVRAANMDPVDALRHE